MIQFPTNVYPQNNAVDANGGFISSFTFNGDRLTWVYDTVYNNETGQKIATCYAPAEGGGKPFKYNGETVSLFNTNNTVFENGKDYSHQMVLMQTDENGSNIYDIYVGRGRLQGDGSSSAMFVESSLNNIYEYDNDYYSAGGLIFTGFKEPLYLPLDRVNIKYQWQESKDSGATWSNLSSDSYTFSKIAIASDNGYQYRCVVSNGTETITSAPAILTISSSASTGDITSESQDEVASETGTLAIIEQPKSQTVPENSVVRFTIRISVNGEEYNIYNYVAAGIMIEINNKRYLVTDYHSFSEDTGIGLLYTNATDDLKLSEGTEYKLYANYLVSPFYFFKCRTTPEVTVSITGNSNGLLCTAIYSQAEGVSLKYYKFRLYEIDSDAEKLIEETDRLYSYRLNYTFPEDYSGKTYKVVCEISTQDSVIVTAETTRNFPDATIKYIANISAPYFVPQTNSVHISWEKLSDCSVRLYRKDMATSDIVLIANTHSAYFDDYTASNNKSYQYIAVPYCDNTVGESLTSDVIDITYIGWTITAITNTNTEIDNKLVYSIGDTWKIIGEIDNVTVTQNTDKTLHVNSAKYPVLSEGDTNYMSGSLSAMIGYVDCDNKTWVDNIDIINAWRRFITQHCQFILKSQKGDVWAVNITESPTTEYDESHYKVLTTISFSWVEFSETSKLL